MIKYRIDSLILYIEIRANCYKITELKKKVIIQYILDIDLKGFLFKFKNIEDTVNCILKLKNIKYIRKF